MKTRVLRRGSVKGAYSPSSNHPFYGWHRFPGTTKATGKPKSPPPGAGEGEKRREKCEDFAPRNEGTRVSEEGGAKRGGRRAPEKLKSGGGNVKILLPETKAQGLAGSGEQREAAAGRPRGSNPAAGM